MREVADRRIDLIGYGKPSTILDTAGTNTIVLLELDVASVTPVYAPGVLDEPVIHAILVAVADDDHSVIIILVTA